MAPDAALCTDGFVTYERIAKVRAHPAFRPELPAGGTKRTPRSHHINTVNALIAGSAPSFCSLFADPPSKGTLPHIGPLGTPPEITRTAPTSMPSGC